MYPRWERTLFGGAETGLPELFLKDTVRILKQGRITRHVWFMSVGRPRMFAGYGKKPYKYRIFSHGPVRCGVRRLACGVHSFLSSCPVARGGLRVL